MNKIKRYLSISFKINFSEYLSIIFAWKTLCNIDILYVCTNSAQRDVNKRTNRKDGFYAVDFSYMQLAHFPAKILCPTLLVV